MTLKNIKRREFSKLSFYSVMTLLLSPKLFADKIEGCEGSAPAIEPANDLNFVPDIEKKSFYVEVSKATKKDPKLIKEQAANYVKFLETRTKNQDLAKKASAKAPNQFCSNCVLLQAPGKSGGKCAVLAMACVSNKGWCKSWAYKPS